MHSRFVSLAVAAAGILLVGCSADNTGPKLQRPVPRMALTATLSGNSYIIQGIRNRLPPNLAASIAAAGGTLTAAIDQIGIAVASSGDPNFQASVAALPGIGSADADTVVTWIDPNEQAVPAGDVGGGTGVTSASIGNDETFFNLQWNMQAVQAPGAWDLGARGTGVRIAVIDGGLNYTHVDLTGQVDVAHSASFVPGHPLFWDDVGTFSHATHVAGIIAAKHNGIGTIGVAPGATIIGVKALQGGSGSFASVIQAIVYAATPIDQGGAGANIINMSLGAGFLREKTGFAHLAAAISKATIYAYQQGVTVIASAGNNGVDIDHTANLIFVPAQSTDVIAVAATGPVGFGLGATDFTRPASYTNFGQSAIDFAAPGGDAVLPGNANCTLALIPSGSITEPCLFFDFVISPGTRKGVSNFGYFFAAGTSMAAPHVAGVAALIIEHHGGILSPASVAAFLRSSADDLGKPGNDDFYGHGFVDALRAVQ